MAIIAGGHIIEGVLYGYTFAGAPGTGTSAVQTLTIDATGGTFRLKYDGFTTADISWNATNETFVANVDAALEALPNVGAGDVTTAVGTMTAGVGTLTITFAAQLGKRYVSVISVSNNALTGTATCSIANDTPGVDPAGMGAATGAQLVDTTNGILYINTGTQNAPTWTKVGVQV